MMVIFSREISLKTAEGFRLGNYSNSSRGMVIVHTCMHLPMSYSKTIQTATNIPKPYIQVCSPFLITNCSSTELAALSSFPGSDLPHPLNGGSPKWMVYNGKSY